MKPRLVKMSLYPSTGRNKTPGRLIAIKKREIGGRLSVFGARVGQSALGGRLSEVGGRRLIPA